MIHVIRVINELDLAKGCYYQALVLSDGSSECLVGISDASAQLFMTTFNKVLSTLANPDNDSIQGRPSAMADLNRPPQGKQDAGPSSVPVKVSMPEGMAASETVDWSNWSTPKEDEGDD